MKACANTTSQQLPLRPTKTLLALSVDRVDKSTNAFRATSVIWEEGFANILADLLRLLRYVFDLVEMLLFLSFC